MSNKIIPCVQPEKDSVFPAVISSLNHPWSFHIQLIDSMHIIAEMISSTMETGEAKTATSVEGLFCLARFQDLIFYRAKILSVQEKDGHVSSVKVIYIDYGLKKAVPPTDIYTLPDCLLKFPSQSLFCALSKASPQNVNLMWPENAIIEFEQCTKNEQVHVRVVHPSPANDQQQALFPHIVDIVFSRPAACKTQVDNPSTQGSMSEHLIHGGLANYITDEEQIEALGTMYSLSGYDRANKDIEGQAVNKVQPCGKIQAKIPGLKTKASHLPLCFKKIKHNINASFTSVEDKTPASTSSPAGLLPPVTSVSLDLKTLQAENDYNLSMMVDKKLRSFGKVTHLAKTKKVYDSELWEEAEVEILVMMSSVISPSSFFVHFVNEESANQFQELEHRLSLLFEQRLSSEFKTFSASFVPTRNSLVCVILPEGGCFYRGLILDTEYSHTNSGNSTSHKTNEKKLLIFLIDYGEFEWIAQDKAFPLPEKFRIVPPMVLWCSLFCVEPYNADVVPKDKATESLWSQEAINKFKSIVNTGKVFSAVILQTSLQEILEITTFQTAPVPVCLLDKNVHGELLSINDELVHLNIAVLSAKKVGEQMCPSDVADDWDPMTEDYKSIRNSYKVNIDEAGIALVGHTAGNVGKNGKKICPYFNRPTGCYRGDNCPNRHVKMDLSNIPSGQVEVKIFDEDQSDLLPAPGFPVPVTVTEVITPALFYVTLPWGHLSMSEVKINPQALDEHMRGETETLESMLDNMQKFYSTNSQYDGDLILLAPGQAMAAKVGDKWLRAMVVESDVERGLVQVRLVDSGSVTWVDERDLRELGLQFMHLTLQALECSLADVVPQSSSSGWTEATCETFAQMVKGQTLVAEFKQGYLDGPANVILYDSSEPGTISVNQRLVDYGLAKFLVRNQTNGIKMTKDDKTADDA